MLFGSMLTLLELFNKFGGGRFDGFADGASGAAWGILEDYHGVSDITVADEVSATTLVLRGWLSTPLIIARANTVLIIYLPLQQRLQRLFATVALKLAGWGKLTEFVTDHHVLADEDWDVNLCRCGRRWFSPPFLERW